MLVFLSPVVDILLLLIAGYFWIYRWPL